MGLGQVNNQIMGVECGKTTSKSGRHMYGEQRHAYEEMTSGGISLAAMSPQITLATHITSPVRIT